MGPSIRKTPEAAAPGRVAVVADAAPPQTVFAGFASGKGDGALKGAGGTFTQCMRGFASGGGCSGGGWACGAAAIIMLGICGVAGVVGGIAGATVAPDAEVAQAAESRLVAATRSDDVQNFLRDQVVAIAKAQGTPLATLAPADARAPAGEAWLRPLSERGVDAVLIVSLTRVGTVGPGVHGPLTLRMDADARLVRTAKPEVLFSAEYRYLHGQHSLADWSADAGARFAEGLKAGTESLASQIHDDVFLLYPFPDRTVQSEGFAPAVFGLAPLAPALSVLGTTTVDALRPTLRWQAFPRPGDREVTPQEMVRVSRVRYDLVVARAADRLPGEIVYRRDALASTTHRLEEALSPGTRYYWTVRARFVLDGRERVTEWSSTYNGSTAVVSMPSPWAYRFETAHAQDPVAE